MNSAHCGWWQRAGSALLLTVLAVTIGLVGPGVPRGAADPERSPAAAPPVGPLPLPLTAPPPPQNLGPVVSIPPTRVLDTRAGFGPIGFDGATGNPISAGPLPANTVRRFLINGKTFPQGTGTFTFTATHGILANVTIVSSTGIGGGFVTVFPGHVADADRPNSSTVNPSTPIAFGFTAVGIKAAGTPPNAGTIAIYTTNTLDVIVDVVGYFTAGAIAVNAGGLVGINTDPASRLHVASGASDLPPRLQSSGTSSYAAGWDFYHGPAAKGYVGVPDAGAGGPGPGEMVLYGAAGVQTSLWADATRALTIDTAGHVGIGTAPDSSAHVSIVATGPANAAGLAATGVGAGRGITGVSTSNRGVSGESASGSGLYGESQTGPGLSVFSVSGNLAQGRNGNGVQVFHINQSGTYIAGSDFAEALPARGGKVGFEPGDVLVLSEEEPGTLDLARQPNDPRLAGVYSTRPGILGADKAGESRVDPDDIPVALLGVVPTKVSAENGPIKPGDLLTTASRPGHAMKAPRRPEPGTVLGKALEPLAEGTGVIRVLVTHR